MSKCIIVFGTGRSGTSAVAGMLHKMGVRMGNTFVQTGSQNPYGTFEDRELYDLNRKVLEGEEKPEAYRQYVRMRQEGSVHYWGVKDPALVSTLQYFISALKAEGVEYKVVSITRDPAECVNSYMRTYYTGRVAAWNWYNSVVLQAAARLLEVPPEIPILELTFDGVMNAPTAVARDLYEFLELPILATDAEWDIIEKAANHIQARQFDNDGWGSLAVGVRIAKHPEPLFFADWTVLLTGGLRKGDTVLMPAMYMPAHHAANKLAQQFLETDKDTLLMVDDDMTFPGDAVERMRTNKENWKYDIVSGMAVRRSIEKPTPILMHYLGRQDMPKELRGDHFASQPPAFELGDVVEVDAVGLAFTFIRRHVLEAMINEDYGLEHTWDFFTYGPGLESDDIPFSRRVRSMGYRMAVDTGIDIGHIADVPLSFDDFVKWLKERGGFPNEEE